MGEVVAVILARGLGRRMREASAEGPALAPMQRAAADAGLKSLVPLPGSDGRARPFLDFVLSGLADAGFRTTVLVVAPEHDALRRRYADEVRPTRLAIEWAIQEIARGTADAVRAAEAVLAGRPFVVVNADNLYPVDGLRALRTLDGPGLLLFERDNLSASSGIPLDRIAMFAIAMLTADRTLAGMVEKPGLEVLIAAGPRAPISMNAWRFDDRIFSACRDVAMSARGELELPEAVRLAITRGVRFRAIAARGPVLDLTSRDDIQHVASRLAEYRVRL